MSLKSYALLGISLYKKLLRLQILGSAKFTFPIRKLFNTSNTNQILAILQNFLALLHHFTCYFMTYHTITWLVITKKKCLKSHDLKQSQKNQIIY